MQSIELRKIYNIYQTNVTKLYQNPNTNQNSIFHIKKRPVYFTIFFMFYMFSFILSINYSFFEIYIKYFLNIVFIILVLVVLWLYTYRVIYFNSSQRFQKEIILKKPFQMKVAWFCRGHLMIILIFASSLFFKMQIPIFSNSWIKKRNFLFRAW